MATTNLTLGSSFTPSTGTFRLQCTGGRDVYRLFSRGTSSEGWVLVDVLPLAKDVRVENPIAGVDYKIEYSGRTKDDAGVDLTHVLRMDQ